MKKYIIGLALAVMLLVVYINAVSDTDADAVAVYGITYVGGEATNGVYVVISGMCTDNCTSFQDDGQAGNYGLCDVRDIGQYELVATFTRNDSLYRATYKGNHQSQIYADNVDLNLYFVSYDPTE